MLHTRPSFSFLLSSASATSFSAPLCTTINHFARLCTTFPPLSTTLHPFTLLCTPLHPFAPLCTPLHHFSTTLHRFDPLFHHSAPAPHISWWQDGRTPKTLCHYCFVHALEGTSFCRTSALSAIVGGCAAVQRYLQLAVVPEAGCSADARAVDRPRRNAAG